MRTGIELLRSTAALLAGGCRCGWGRCEICSLRVEIEAYLAMAAPKHAKSKASAVP